MLKELVRDSSSHKAVSSKSKTHAERDSSSDSPIQLVRDASSDKAASSRPTSHVETDSSSDSPVQDEAHLVDEGNEAAHKTAKHCDRRTRAPKSYKDITDRLV